MAKVNIKYDKDGNETFRKRYVVKISSQMQIDYPILISKLTLVKDYVPYDGDEDNFTPDFEKKEARWVYAHAEKQKVNKKRLRKMRLRKEKFDNEE